MSPDLQHAIHTLKEGYPVILVDHEDRENEGDLIYPAECITPDIINMMIRYCSGIICLCLTPSHAKLLNLPLMVPTIDNKSRFGTAFTVSIEARDGVDTGVSAHDRCRTIQAAMTDPPNPQHLVSPGHVFPLQAHPGGVLQRPGHTEGSIDVMRIAGFKPAAVLCEVMNPDGSMAKMPELQQFAEQHHSSILTLQTLIEYRTSLS